LGKEEDTTVGAIHGKNFFEQSGKESITLSICNRVPLFAGSISPFVCSRRRLVFGSTTPTARDTKSNALYPDEPGASGGRPEFLFHSSTACVALEWV
jgi:hypothetical protein